MNTRNALARLTSVRANLPWLPVRSVLTIALFASLPSVGAAAAGTTGSAKSTSDAAKPFALYLGMDLQVECQGKLRPVKDVQGASFIVDVDGRRVAVPTQFHGLKIKIDPALKVSPSGITVSDFKPERAYTYDRDPNRILAQAAAGASSESESIDVANAKLVMLQGQMMGIQANAQAHPLDTSYGEHLGELTQMMNNAQDGVNQALAAQGATINSIGDAASRAAIEAGRELYDAFRLTFDVSAPKPIAKPYMIIVVRRQDDPDKPNTLRQWVYAQELDPIGPKPRTIRLFRDGFPAGYKLVDVQLHLYSAGVEMATNVAHKHVGLTADEAFQFTVVNYVEEHKNATLHPVVAKAGVTESIRSRLPGVALNRIYYVKVAKSGIPAGAFTNEGCTEVVDNADLEAALSATRFYPALKNGKPVEAVVRVRI